MLKLYRLHKGGMATTGYLPGGGGAADQSLLMMRCFDFIAFGEIKGRDVGKDT